MVSTRYPPKPHAIKPGFTPGVTVLTCEVSYLFILIVAIPLPACGLLTWQATSRAKHHVWAKGTGAAGESEGREREERDK